jgi:hypothetical protein
MGSMLIFLSYPPPQPDRHLGFPWPSALPLLEAKLAAPLDALSVPSDVERAVAEHNTQCDRIRESSDELAAADAELETVKEQAREANIATLTSDLANLRAVEARHDPAVAPLCDEYLSKRRRRPTPSNGAEPSPIPIFSLPAPCWAHFKTNARSAPGHVRKS